MKQDAQPIDLDSSQRFDALKMRYQDHVELLRYLTGLELRLFSGVITIQVAIGSWLATSPIESSATLFLLLALNFVLVACGIVLFINNILRRKEAVETLENINLALGFDTRGYYLADRALNAPSKRRVWGPWYIAGIVIAFIGVAVIAISANTVSEPDGGINSESLRSSP